MRMIALSVLALTLLTSTAGYAQNYDNHRSDRGDDSSRWDRDGDHDERTWSRSERLPREYFRERYVHRGWQDSGLRQPPRAMRAPRNERELARLMRGGAGRQRRRTNRRSSSI